MIHLMQHVRITSVAVEQVPGVTDNGEYRIEFRTERGHVAFYIDHDTANKLHYEIQAIINDQEAANV